MDRRTCVCVYEFVSEKCLCLGWAGFLSSVFRKNYTESRTLTNSFRARSRKESMFKEVCPRCAPVGCAGDEAAATAAAVELDIIDMR